MKINGLNFLIGADPEFFVQRGGKPTSAHGLVRGTKEAPLPVEKGAVQVDGMALEFNINPADSFSAFEDHITSVLDQTMSMIPGYEIFVESPPEGESEARVDAKIGRPPRAVADFGVEYLASQPEEARELGCNPDFNAYTRAQNPRPDGATPFRTASGHVHIGWTSDVDVNDPGHLEACYALVKSLDAWLGIPSLIWDNEDRRRELYGKAGAFRPKHYGLEYRVLSNKWILSPILRKTVYWNTIEAIRKTFDNPNFGDTQFYGLTAQEIVNKANPKWYDSVGYALRYEQIRAPAWYRNNTPS